MRHALEVQERRYISLFDELGQIFGDAYDGFADVLHEANMLFQRRERNARYRRAAFFLVCGGAIFAEAAKIATGSVGYLAGLTYNIIAQRSILAGVALFASSKCENGYLITRWSRGLAIAASVTAFIPPLATFSTVFSCASIAASFIELHWDRFARIDTSDILMTLGVASLSFAPLTCALLWASPHFLAAIGIGAAVGALGIVGGAFFARDPQATRNTMHEIQDEYFAPTKGRIAIVLATSFITASPVIAAGLSSIFIANYVVEYIAARALAARGAQYRGD